MGITVDAEITHGIEKCGVEKKVESGAQTFGG